MKVLIFGSEGFIGRNLVSYFLAKGYDVTGCDLLQPANQNYSYYKISRLTPEYEEVFDQRVYDVCINASGNGNVPYSMTHPFNDFEANCLDTLRMLECLRRYQKSCRYVYISSAAVYGNPEKLPVLETDRLQPLSPYGWHKLIGENLCKEYSHIYGLSIVIVRPFSVYGPGLQKQLFWDLFQKFKSGHASIELWGTGSESRDFIFIHDLVKSIEILIHRSSMNAEVYNAASGSEITIKEVSETFFRILDPSIKIQFNNNVRGGDPLNWRADVSKIKNLGFEPETNIIEGINILTAWMRSLS